MEQGIPNAGTGRTPVRTKAGMRRFWIWTITLSVALVAGAEYVSARYAFAMNIQLDGRCVPEDYFVVDKWATDYQEGDYLYFQAERMDPWIKTGTPVIKVVAATPGGVLEVKADGTAHVNGTYWGELDRLQKLNKTAAEFERVAKVPEGHLLAMGTLPRSYDGRYWGFVNAGQILGKAYALY